MALEKASITNTVTGECMEVMFNPEEYTVNTDVNFAQQTVPGLSAPVIQFVSGNMQTLEMELLIDTYEAHGSKPLPPPTGITISPPGASGAFATGPAGGAGAL